MPRVWRKVDLPRCEGKVCYPDKRTAQERLNVLRKGSHEGRGTKRRPERIYQCQECDGWHMTHIREKDWKRRE